MENRKKRPRKPKEEENKPGRYDPRNTLNDLTGKEWLLLTKSFWETETSVIDKGAYKHPAPFMVGDIKKLISLYTKKEMVVLDPFVGSGTSLIAADMLDRKGIGIDLNPEYKNLYMERLQELEIDSRSEYYIGDSLEVLDNIGRVDYIVTSPPYHNILRNNSKGTRNNNGKNYRMSARDGVEYYSELSNDLGNFAYQSQLMQLAVLAMREIGEKTITEDQKGIIKNMITSHVSEQEFNHDIVLAPTWIKKILQR